MDVILFIQYFSFLLCPMTVPVTGTRTESDYITYITSLRRCPFLPSVTLTLQYLAMFMLLALKMTLANVVDINQHEEMTYI